MIICNCRTRANAKSVPFNLVKEDIVVPDKCPVFGTSFREAWAAPQTDFMHSYAPSIDRIKNELGYVKDNIVIVSCRANSIKGNATPEELLKVAAFYAQFKS